MKRDGSTAVDSKGTRILRDAIYFAGIGCLDHAHEKLERYFRNKNMKKSERVYEKVTEIYRDTGLRSELQRTSEDYAKYLADPNVISLNPIGLDLFIKNLQEYRSLLDKD